MTMPSSLRRTLFAAPLALALLAWGADAIASGVPPAQATAAQREQAQSRFLRGKELFGAGRYDAALAEFAASFDVVASPNTRLYIARCHREKGSYAIAYNEFSHTAQDAKQDAKYAPTADAALEERVQLEPKIGLVTVAVAHPTHETTVKIGGEELKREQWNEPVPVMPGTTEVVAETPGKPPAKESVQIVAGDKKSVSLDVEPAVAKVEPPPPEPASSEGPKYRPVLYAAGGVAVVGLATFLIAGTMANGTHSDLEDACGAGPCPPGHEDDISAGRTQQTIANVGLVFAVVGAAAAATIFVIDRPKSDAKPSALPLVRARVVAGPTFTGITGAF